VDTLKDVHSFITRLVGEASESAHEIVENATHYAFEVYGRDDLGPEIKRFTLEAVVAYHVTQATWPSPTDRDRLDEAFTALNVQGIVARQNFSCCNNCGFAEIWDEVEEAEKTQPIEGYVFYHLQSTERALQTGQLLMAYGCVEEDKESLERVVHKIISELQRVGLKASWAGSGGHPIIVEDLKWQRRRTDALD
jgi:hypothetical protein